MAKESINTGTFPNDHTGDGIRIAFNKTNNNFSELYTTVTSAFDRANSVASRRCYCRCIFYTYLREKKP